MSLLVPNITTINGGSKKIIPVKKNNIYYFKDHPEFKPNRSPEEIFRYGSFGGTYWRPIKSKFFKLNLKTNILKYPKSWWKGIPDSDLVTTFDQYDKTVNKYGEQVGSTLEEWEKKTGCVKIILMDGYNGTVIFL